MYAYLRLPSTFAAILILPSGPVFTVQYSPPSLKIFLHDQPFSTPLSLPLAGLVFNPSQQSVPSYQTATTLSLEAEESAITSIATY